MESMNKYISLTVLVLGLVVIWLRPGDKEELLRRESVISSLLKYEENHVDKTSPKIAVGFGACKDLFVTRSHMMDGVSFPETVDNYLGVGSQEELVSMLGYFFQAGAAAEVREDDVHLIVEYKRQEEWGGVVSPRANRFIVHHDLNNPLVSSLEQFSASLSGFSPQLLVVGGLQMMDNFPFREGQRVERILGIRNLLESVDQNTLIHFEMASFVDESLLSELTEHIIPQVDSVGMNEQELPNLESMLSRGEVVEVADSNPRIAVMLDMMRTVYRRLGVMRPGARPLTRLHLHTLAYQVRGIFCKV